MKPTTYKLQPLNSTVVNNTIMVSLPGKPHKTVKIHSKVGNFAIVPIIVNRDGTVKQNENRALAGQSYTKRAYRLSHIITGARVSDFYTIGAAKECALFLERTADFLGCTWNGAEWSTTDWRAISHDIKEYRREFWQGHCFNTIVDEFPTAVNNT